ncbi:4a-hydroxytetrahydrobiopterin dehydratase [Phycisphaerales bacterium AB-hyl4]|uniref:Putative pterin-4-alpha-carbinolamine dehydratase n=1 Tax=Natronomicrosphaera hydrolytica TaxID=3242702 RepID=A0ABV4U105_9BACT
MKPGNPETFAMKDRRCAPCEGGTPPMDDRQIADYLPHTPGWKPMDHDTAIERTFKLSDFHEALAFVNAVAWIAHREDHHPIIELNYRQIRLRYTTHAIGGLSENDFICAAKVNALLDSPTAG